MHLVLSVFYERMGILVLKVLLITAFDMSSNRFCVDVLIDADKKLKPPWRGVEPRSRAAK